MEDNGITQQLPLLHIVYLITYYSIRSKSFHKELWAIFQHFFCQLDMNPLLTHQALYPSSTTLILTWKKNNPTYYKIINIFLIRDKTRPLKLLSFTVSSTNRSQSCISHKNRMFIATKLPKTHS